MCRHDDQAVSSEHLGGVHRVAPAVEGTFWRRIVRLSQAGTTIVVTTHFMEEAEYCDRILIQDNGRILASGTPLEVRTRANAESIDEAFRQIVLNARRAEAEDKRAKSSEAAR